MASPVRGGLIRTPVTNVKLLLFGTFTSVTLIGIALYGQGFAFLTAQGDEFGEFAILDPTDWAGDRFGLIEHVNIEGDLAHGKWEILFFRNDCNACHEVMKQMVDGRLETDFRTFALIAIDGVASEDALIKQLSARGCLVGHLSLNREWFGTTPLRVSLNDGMCMEARIIQRWE
jgi:hypothetical protein